MISRECSSPSRAHCRPVASTAIERLRGREHVSLIGQPLRRQEDPRLLRGWGSYVADLRPAGLLHLAVLRSPHAHARLAARDFSDAARGPGVVAILGPEDVAWLTPLPVMIQPAGTRNAKGEWARRACYSPSTGYAPRQKSGPVEGLSHRRGRLAHPRRCLHCRVAYPP